MLISIGQIYFVYIRKTNKINEILRAHNSGICSQTSQTEHLYPYSALAYICGLGGNQSCICYIEKKQKYKKEITHTPSTLRSIPSGVLNSLNKLTSITHTFTLKRLTRFTPSTQTLSVRRA